MNVGNAWDLGIVNEVDGVACSCVLGDGGVIIVWLSSSAIINDILQDRTESNSIVDFRFFLLAQANALGVASSFNVEDTSVGPDVLVVTDESSLRVGGEGAVYTKTPCQ